ncbi:MAG: hypothetical protein ACM3RR_00180 [Bacillota bacterium]
MPVISGRAWDWGTDKETYSRGDTATGWTNITNTGTVPIDEICFTVTIEKLIFGFPVERSYSHTMKGLDIAPGETRKVQFSERIPAKYKGIPTAGNYKFNVTAWLDNKDIGNYTKNIKVI